MPDTDTTTGRARKRNAGEVIITDEGERIMPPLEAHHHHESLHEALAAAQAEIVAPTKSRTVNTGSYSYSYAELADVLRAVREPFGRHGLYLTQEAVNALEAGTVLITTTIGHESGQTITTKPLELPAGGNAQAIGSAITYGRRYQLSALLGVAAEEDDDGAAASSPATVEREPATAPRVNERQMRRIHALARTKGVSHDELHAWAERHLEVGSLADMTPAGAARLESSLKELPDAEPEANDGAPTMDTGGTAPAEAVGEHPRGQERQPSAGGGSAPGGDAAGAAAPEAEEPAP